MGEGVVEEWDMASACGCRIALSGLSSVRAVIASTCDAAEGLSHPQRE